MKKETSKQKNTDKCKIYLRNLTCDKCKGKCPADKMEDLWYIDCYKFYK
jgi:hypothetical protein